MSRRWAAAVVRARYFVVAFWVAAVVAAMALLPTIEEAQVGALGDLVPADAAALDAELRSAELFGFPLQSRTILVQRDPEGLPAEERRDVVRRAVELNLGRLERFRKSVPGAIPFVNSIGEAPLIKERDTAALTYFFFDPEIGRVGQTGLAQLYAERTGAEAVVGVTGTLPARQAQAEAIRDALPLVELLTVIVVTFTVGLHYRALLAPLANLLAIGIAYLIAVRALAGIGRAVGISVPSEVEPVVVVLLFGVLTDYSIFFFSRARRALEAGADPHETAIRVTGDLVPTILTAGGTVALAAGALAFGELGFIRAFGPGLSISIVVAVAVALTLIPAMLAIAGRALFWPHPRRAPADQPGERPVRSRAVSLASRRPWLTMAGCTIVLLAAGTGVLRMEVGQTLIRGLPSDAEPRQAYRAAAQAFAPGLLAPTTVILEGEDIAQREQALATVQERLRALPGVAAVIGPADRPAGLDPIGAVTAPGGDAVRFGVVFDADPLGAAAIRHLRTLRLFIPDILDAAELEGARVSIAGDTALAEETVTLAESDVVRVAPITLVAVLAVLAVFLRAIVAPIYLVVASLLGLAAALGLTVYLFQDVLGHGELTFYVPFTAAVLLFSLGSDYNVFLTGRIWAEARRRPLREAVAVAGSRAATAITVAGLVLAASFALLALVPVRPFRELGFVMAVGLLLDAFLVRTLLVPAMVAAFGRR